MLENVISQKKRRSLQQSQGNFSCTRMGGGCIVCMQMTDPAQDHRGVQLARPSGHPFPFSRLLSAVWRIRTTGDRSDHRRRPAGRGTREPNPNGTHMRRAARYAPRAHGGMETCNGRMLVCSIWTRQKWHMVGSQVTGGVVVPKLQIFPKSFVIMLSAPRGTVPFPKNEATVVKNDWCC
jgi:hypothetical protein